MEIALRVHVVVWSISSNISRCTGPIFAIFSPYKSTLGLPADLYLIFQFVKGRCHGNQVTLPCHNEGKLILCAFFARLLDDSTVSFCYYLLGSDTVVQSRLLARLCHAFLVSNFSATTPFTQLRNASVFRDVPYPTVDRYYIIAMTEQQQQQESSATCSVLDTSDE